jgi:hypothetical protein
LCFEKGFVVPVPEGVAPWAGGSGGWKEHEKERGKGVFTGLGSVPVFVMLQCLGARLELWVPGFWHGTIENDENNLLPKRNGSSHSH